MLNKHAIAHQQIGDPFAPGKLCPTVHAALVNELSRFASEAGVSPLDVTGAQYALTDFERVYFKRFRRHRAEGTAGLLYIGPADPPVTERMRSSVGALLRNYISARFMPREELVHELWDRKRYPKFDFIAVPDLSVDNLPEAPKRSVAAWLVRRITRGEQTAVGVSSKKVLTDLLGSDAAAFSKHFHTYQPGALN